MIIICTQCIVPAMVINSTINMTAISHHLNQVTQMFISQEFLSTTSYSTTILLSFLPLLTCFYLPIDVQ